MVQMLRRFGAVAVSAALVVMLSGGLPLRAQEPATAPTEAKARTTRRAYDPTRRVPMYFGQLGLTEPQRESIYEIQGKHVAKIEAMEKQIEDLRSQMMKECEGVLTPAQKQLLEQRRKSGAEARPRRGSSAKAEH